MAWVASVLKVDEKQKDEFLHEIENLKQTVERLKEENSGLKKENVALIKAANPNQHDKDFWDDIYDKMKSDPDYVRSLIKKKEVSMKEVDGKGRTILLIASYWGQYDIVQFLLNLGADIKHRDYNDKQAIDLARGGSFYHVEQLLLFNQMNANVGNKVQQTADVINEQNSIIENIINQLSNYDETTKSFFKDTMIDIMTNIIKQKLAFSDVFLNLCWEFETDPLNSKLWSQLLNECKYIIQNGDKKDWFWFKNFVLPSAIWFKEINTTYLHDEKDEKDEMDEKEEKNDGNKKNKTYLYYVLLKLVNKESDVQLNKLEENLNKLASKNQAHWDALVKWDIEDQYSVVRQDSIPNGITAEYTDSQLFEYASGSFNTHKFYDYNEYLPQLVLLAQLVDDEFQKSVQNIFNIDKHTRSSHIQIDEKDDSNTPNIEYSRGPVKLMTRARAKAQNDYVNEPFPTSSCVLDLNRCSLIFNDISSLLAAIQLFINKVKFYQSGCIIGIVRDKNGFLEYVKEVQYSDIKLNVLIKGKQRNIIGEVQFLLFTMKMYKNKAHNLYAVQREQEYIENSVSVILPRLMDLDKQSAVAGNMGDAKTLLKLMVVNNKTDEDLLKIDSRGESILLNLCSLGIEKAFYLLKSIVNRELFMDRLFKDAKSGSPIGKIFQGNHVILWRMAISMKEVKERCKIDLNLHIILCATYKHSNPKLINQVLNELNVSNEKLVKLLSFIPPKDGLQDRIIINAVNNKDLNVVKNLVVRIGEKEFVNSIFINNGYDTNAIEIAANSDKIENIKYVMSFSEIKNTYLDEKNLNKLFRLMFWAFAKSNKESTIDVVMEELNISNELLIKVFKHKYDEKIEPHILKNNWKYCNYKLISRIIIYKKLNIVQKLESILGRKELVELIFTNNMFDKNGVENSIPGKHEPMIKYLISMDETKQMYSNNDQLLWRLIFWLFAWSAKTNVSFEIIDFVFDELHITKEQMNKIILLTYKKTSEIFAGNCWKYYEYSIMHRVIEFKTFNFFQRFLSFIDLDNFVDLFVYKMNDSDINCIEHACMKNKPEFVEYLLSNEKVKNVYLTDESFLWRLVLWIFMHRNVSNQVKNYVLDALEITQQQLIKLLSYRYTKPLLPDAAWEYSNYSICTKVIFKTRLPSIQFFVSKIGREAFCCEVFMGDPGQNLNTIEYTIRFNELDKLKYLFSFDEIVEKCANQINILWRIVFNMFVDTKVSNELIEYVLNTLNVTKEQMNKLIDYRYIKDEKVKFNDSAWEYHGYTIFNRVIWYSSVEKLQKLVSLIDEKIFFDNMFIQELETQYNPMEFCVRRKKIKIMKYLMSFDKIKQKCLNDTQVLIEIIEEMQRSFDETMFEYIAKELNLNIKVESDMDTLLNKLKPPKELYILSATKKWRPCEVTQVLENGKKWKIHYKGYSKKYDEILDSNSERLTTKKPETDEEKKEKENEEEAKKNNDDNTTDNNDDSEPPKPIPSKDDNENENETDEVQPSAVEAVEEVESLQKSD